MQVYNIVLPQLIIEKIRQQALVIALDKPSVAIKWYDLVFEKIFSLESMPERCPEASESQYFTFVIRQLLIGDYRVLFHIVDNTVRVLEFKGGKQNKPE